MRAITFLTIVTFVLLMAVLFTLPLHAADKIKVMVIDTGVATKHPALKKYNIISFSDNDTLFDNIHGTAISSLVMNGTLYDDGTAESPVCSNVQLYICNYKPDEAARLLTSCLDKAVALKVDFVNYSSTGGAFMPSEYQRIAAMPNTTFVTAAGNEGTDLNKSPRFPGMYNQLEKFGILYQGYKNLKNIIMVGALTSQGSRWDMSNYGVPMQMEQGANIRTAYVISAGKAPMGYGTALVSGTSGATALHTNRLIRQRCQEAK